NLVADSSSTNAVSVLSARTTKRCLSSRCASAIQIVCPLESIAETQSQLQPGLLRLSALISQYGLAAKRGLRCVVASTLPTVITSPEWLKICVMKCDLSLFDISKIKGSKWSNVIDVPSFSTIILPRHSRQKPSLKVSD